MVQIPPHHRPGGSQGLQIHLILDNYATHKHATCASWLDKHPRFHLHFTPTSSSWLNLVERWFRELTDKALRRGVFGSVPDLVASIQEYIDAHNNDPKPYVWTATAESILAKVARGRITLEKSAKYEDTPLAAAVRRHVLFRSLRRIVDGVHLVIGRHMRLIHRRQNVFHLVKLGCFAVVPCCVLMMFCRTFMELAQR